MKVDLVRVYLHGGELISWELISLVAVVLVKIDLMALNHEAISDYILSLHFSTCWFSNFPSSELHREFLLSQS